VGAVTSYTFTNVQAAHSISATFKVQPTNTYTITVTQGANGTISPGTTTVAQGSSATFAIAPSSGYTIASVTVDGVSVGTVSSYTFSNVQAAHTITAAFTSGTPTVVLLSQGKTATASTQESTTYSAAKAVDGSTTTRWASQDPATGPEWLSVDLGATKTITQVILNWEAAYGKAFRIDVSDSATYANYTTIYSTTTGTGGNATLSGLSGSGRYIRIYCTTRGTSWGYSLFEFKAYGY
jgi:hypothetical protein